MTTTISTVGYGDNSDYGKSRKLLETFKLIKSGIATTPLKIADIFGTSTDNIHN